MSNISITNRCNKKCSYCFAIDSQNQKSQYKDMKWQTFNDSISYLKRSGISQVRLLGGEPTLHKDFIRMVEQSLNNGFEVLIFSNGLMPEAVAKFLVAMSHKQYRILLNTIHPNENFLSGENKQKEIMMALGRKVMLGINIFSRNQDLNFLLQLIKCYKLYPKIRIGIAHPVLSGRNKNLLPKFYSIIGQKVVELYKESKKNGIKIMLDCGFVPCMFPEDNSDIRHLLKCSGSQCNPNIDILPDGKLISCYPLNNMVQFELTPKITHSKLVSLFNNERSVYKDIGIFPYCSLCDLFTKSCHGGCLAQKIKRLKFNHY